MKLKLIRKKNLKESPSGQVVEKKAKAPKKEKEVKNNFVTFDLDGDVYTTTLSNKYKNRKPHERKDPKKILSFIPGTIQKVFVQVGDKVMPGDKLLILEAMKMKNILTTTVEGTVKAVYAELGKMVANKQVLVELE